MEKTYDKSWYTAFGLGLNAMAVTAPVCPRKTDIGKPSGKRHYENEIVKHNVAKNSLGRRDKKKQETCLVTLNLTTRMTQSFDEDATKALFELTAKSVMSPY